MMLLKKRRENSGPCSLSIIWWYQGSVNSLGHNAFSMTLKTSLTSPPFPCAAAAVLSIRQRTKFKRKHTHTQAQTYVR